MDPRDLKTASTYVNNLLAARGLLRGDPINFARPTREDGTPARIINLVHELVSRRDREAEQRENLAQVVRTLRSTETKQTTAIAALKAEIKDLERKNSLLEAQVRNANNTLHRVESSTKTLRDETVRFKTLLAQARTSHANDLRKRDLQIQKMKERLTDTRRVGPKPAHAIVISAHQSINVGGSKFLDQTVEARAVSPGLLQDTTEYLTAMSQELADENDNLLALLRRCLSQLKVIQGLPDTNHIAEMDGEEVNIVAPPAKHEALSYELDAVMQSLQDMLNQPNYVPVEDLVERDAQIVELKKRNETLQEEWRKAIDLVDNWNRDLAASVGNEVAMIVEGPVGPPDKPAVGLPLVEVSSEKENIRPQSEAWQEASSRERVVRGDPVVEAVIERRRSLRSRTKAGNVEGISPKPEGVTKKRRKPSRR